MFFWDLVLDGSIMPIGSKAKVAMAVAQKLQYKLDQNAIHQVMALRNAFAHHETGSHPVYKVGKTEAENEVNFHLQVITNSGTITLKRRQEAHDEFIRCYNAAKKSLIDLLAIIRQ